MTTRLAYSPKQAAEDTSLSEHRIRDAINRGQLKAKRDGARLVILAADLTDFLTALPDKDGTS